MLSGVGLILWADEWCPVYLQVCGWSEQISLRGSEIASWHQRHWWSEGLSLHITHERSEPVEVLRPGHAFGIISLLDVTYLGHRCYHVPEWDVLILKVSHTSIHISDIGNRKSASASWGDWRCLSVCSAVVNGMLTYLFDTCARVHVCECNCWPDFCLSSSLQLDYIFS